MRSSIDTLLAEESRTDGAVIERTLSVAREELARNHPVRRWRTEAAWMFAASAVLTAVVAGVLLVLGQTSASFLLGRAPLLALLWATSAVCAWGALTPRGRRLQLVGVGMAMVSAATLVLARGSFEAEPTLPGWVCTVSHVGVGLIPLVVSVVLLRGAAFRPLRALLAGLSVGTTGAFVGELACAQGWRHVLGYHLSAWALVTVATLTLSRLLVPRSFAP
uniref:Carotenogenesis protein CarR n=1 Tax=Vitiosangium cumulatum TaxID=1867796 RepID=A0A7D5BWD7_9BACT|nr:carotenogenesis protein CarR [Vitiosangium cumulatum]